MGGMLLSDVGTKGQRVFSGSLEEISKIQMVGYIP
ncbi:MAG: hypothetical protein CM15mP6_1580 [Methanobacteriota archaeon]|nr:MAG: hypothetical protein CM15mP6_1580 [Euryarchaeota archaeon]